MGDFTHVYLDDENVIQEIEFSDATPFDQYKHIIIPNNMAEEIHRLREKWERHHSIKSAKFMLLETDGMYQVKKAVFIYYHFKNNSIHSITPRKQETLDDDGDLRCGLVVVDDTLKECIDGTKSMINCRVNTDDDDVLVFEEIPEVKIVFDIAKSLTLLIDYEVKENESAVIDITYDGNILNIKRTGIGALGREYQLFFIDRFDKTIFYDSVFFVFTADQEEINVPLILDDNYMVISLYRNILSFSEV